MSNDPVPAGGEAMPIDPVLAIARKLARADAFSRLAEQNKARERVDHQEDRRANLRDQLALVEATTLAGAAVQVAELLNLFDTFRDCIPYGDITSQVERDARAIVRLAFSAMTALESAAGVKVDALVYDGYAAYQRNPWGGSTSASSNENGSIETVIGHFIAAERGWQQTKDEAGDLVTSGPEAARYDHALRALACFPCHTPAAARRKVEFIGTHPGLFETLRSNADLQARLLGSLVTVPGAE
ncbi:hypothetical protein ACLE20_06870 [Rhizobium sp. YIM 134829]|uniref:hypothetical protein n=1 Tax=Rhizobium sp. YIM 134829 TaxID=3390453 RepID=UPI00397CC1C2